MVEQAPVDVFDHRRKLMQVADQQQLHAAKGQIAAAVTAQNSVNAIQQVGPNHAYLINHQQVEAFDDIDLFLVEPVSGGGFTAGDEWTERHLEKRMQSDPAGIDGGHPGGCGDDHPFGTFLLEIVQKSRFSGAGFARQINIAAGVTDKFIGEL